MPDVYADITAVDPAVVAQVADAMEMSAADPQQRDMVATYVADLALTGDAHVLEVGCGTGAIARMLASSQGVGDVLGIDPSPILIQTATELSAGIGNVSYREADGRCLPFADATFDAVVVHRVLSHVPRPEQVLAEAFRVLRDGGRIAVFDGDYATITLATGDLDPLETCVAAFRLAYITDPWVVRRLPAVAEAAGFRTDQLRSYGYVQVRDPGYMLTIAERGADALAGSGRIGVELADALKSEARRRASARSFFGHIAYASLTARKPGDHPGG